MVNKFCKQLRNRANRVLQKLLNLILYGQTKQKEIKSMTSCFVKKKYKENDYASKNFSKDI